MKFNKRCLATFSDENPFIAMGTKSKLFDTSFSLTSELFLYDYSKGIQYPSLQTDNKFYKLRWCENGENGILATGNEDGKVTLYTPAPDKDISFEMISTCNVLEGDVLGLDFNPSKNVLAAGSSNGKIIFWNLNKIDNQYTSDIPLNSNITCLSWNRKVSRILCAGTDDGKILILDIRAKNVAMTLGNDEMTMVTDVMWHPDGSTSILATTNQKKVQCFNLSSDSIFQIGNHNNGLIGLSIVDGDNVAAYSKEQIDIIETKENKVVDSMFIDGVFEMSFSKKDPLIALSYTGGTTEIIPRITKNILSCNPGCIINDEIIGINNYKIENEKMKEVEEDILMKKIKNLLYKDGVYKLNRMELGELLLNEEINKDSNDIQNESENLNDIELKEKISNLSMDLRFNLKDPLTLALIKGNLDEAYERSITSEKMIPFSLFLALAKGKNSLPLDSNDVLVLLSIAQLTSTFSHVLEKISKDQWMSLLSLISFSSLNDSEFISTSLKIAEKLDDKDKLIIYAIINKLDKYFELKTSIYDMPTNVYEVKDFFQSYKNIVIDLESMDGYYKSPILSEYFWYAMAHGDKPTKIKYDDLSINIHLGKISNGIKVTGKPSPPIGKNVQEKVDGFTRRSPILEPSIPLRSGIPGVQSTNIPPIKPGLQSKMNVSSTPGYGSIESTIQESSKSQGIPTSPASGIKISPGFPKPNIGNTMYNKPQASKSEVIPSPTYKNIPQPSTTGLTYGSSPQNIKAPSTTVSQPSPKAYIPKPPSHVTTPQGMSSSPSTYASIPQGTQSKSYIPGPKMTPIPTPFTYSSSQKNIPTSQPSIPSPPQHIPSSKTPIHSTSNVQEQPISNLNSEEILNTFETIIQDLTDKASSKANLIIRNKLKEVTKRLSIYNSVPKDTFNATILNGIDKINQEIKNDNDIEMMKQKVREIIVKCTETGENRVDLWMPSVYTLLQIVYH